MESGDRLVGNLRPIPRQAGGHSGKDHGWDRLDSRLSFPTIRGHLGARNGEYRGRPSDFPAFLSFQIDHSLVAAELDIDRHARRRACRSQPPRTDVAANRLLLPSRAPCRIGPGRVPTRRIRDHLPRSPPAPGGRPLRHSFVRPVFSFRPIRPTSLETACPACPRTSTSPIADPGSTQR
jgi:hypothetical protein